MNRRSAPVSQITAKAWIGVLVIQLLLASSAGANLSVCGDCICIEWSLNTGIYIEVRCTEASGGGADGGWTLTPPPSGAVPDNPGSFGGASTLNDYSYPPPGSPIDPGSQTQKLNSAKSNAGSKLVLNCHKDPATQEIRCWETTCTSMFANNKTHIPGSQLLGSVAYRKGAGYTYVKDGVTKQPCVDNPNTIAFVRSVNDRYIFLCNNFFTLGPSSAAEALIHELLHVAGQLEDLNSSAGPNNPPNSDGIQTEVENACGSPSDVGEGY